MEHDDLLAVDVIDDLRKAADICRRHGIPATELEAEIAALEPRVRLHERIGKAVCPSLLEPHTAPGRGAIIEQELAEAGLLIVDLTERAFVLEFAPNLVPFVLDSSKLQAFLEHPNRPALPRGSDDYSGANLAAFVKAGITAGVITAEPRLALTVDADDHDETGLWWVEVTNSEPPSRQLTGKRRNVENLTEHDPDDEPDAYAHALFGEVVHDANTLLPFPPQP